MSRNNLIELAGTLQAMRVYVLEHGARYKPAADALIDVLVELHRAAKWREWELRRIGRVGTEITSSMLTRQAAPVSRDRPRGKAQARSCCGVHGAVASRCAGLGTTLLQPRRD